MQSASCGLLISVLDYELECNGKDAIFVYLR